MKPIFILIFVLLPLAVSANPIKRANQSPTVNDPLVPGTKVPIHELNTSPNPTPNSHQSEKFRGTLKGSKEYGSRNAREEEEKVKKKKEHKK